MFWRVIQFGCLTLLITLAVFLQFVPWQEDVQIFETQHSLLAVSRERITVNVLLEQSPSLPPPALNWHLLGLSVDRANLIVRKSLMNQPWATVWVVKVSVLWIAFLLAIPPAIWAFRFRKVALRWLAGERPCRKCGYDLRATPDRCPECGTPAAPPQ